MELADRFMKCCLKLCKYDITVDELKHISDLLHKEEAGHLHYIPISAGETLYRIDIEPLISSGNIALMDISRTKNYAVRKQLANQDMMSNKIFVQ